MPNFHWRDRLAAPLPDRFPDTSVGLDPWKDLVDVLARGVPLRVDQCQREFDQFLLKIAAPPAPPAPPRYGPPPTPECRVFVSHRQTDVVIAERIAELASIEQFGYWLDVHDPVLTAVGGASIPSPQKEFLMAAIIEMALLNATHVIAAMTPNSHGSKWIPYELGRAKQRVLRSDLSAVWLHPHTTAHDCGEYVRLVEITTTEQQISDWLSNSRAKDCKLSSGSQWGTRPSAPELPKPK